MVLNSGLLKIKQWLISIALIITSFLFANEESIRGSKKYNISICAIFKNEAPYFKEWIEYHRLIGIDHFYLYNNGSKDRSAEILRPYINNNIVTLIHWPDRVGKINDEDPMFWALGTQIGAFENAIKYRALNETKWLAILSVDEFLVPPESNNLQETMLKYDEFPGISLTTDFFDASNYDRLSNKKLLIQTLELTSPPQENLNKSVSKIIFKPEMCKQFTWPPYRVIFEDGLDVPILRKANLKINRYTNRNWEHFLFRKNKNKAHVDNRTLGEEEMTELLDEGYEIEDQDQSIFRFVPELLKKMGLDKGWIS